MRGLYHPGYAAGMGRLVWATLVVITGLGGLGGLGACGGDDSGDGNAPDDAHGIDGIPPICDPILAAGAQGCPVGQRCTWVSSQETPTAQGELKCVTDGTFVAGATCTPSVGGEPDRCTTGLICVAGTCQDICGFDGRAESACAVGHACTRYEGVFASGGGDPLAGACTPTCDPLTQRRPGDELCPPGQGCYLVTGVAETVAVCAPVGAAGHGVDLVATPYANSCVPGAQPRRKNSASDTIECGGLCKPIDVTSTMARASEGGFAPDSCMVRWGAAPPDHGGLGESCRYWSAREPFAALSPFSNTVGWCFKHVGFVYDPDGDGTADSQFPRCAALTEGDVVPPMGNPPHNDARYFWCLAQTTPREPSITIPQVRADRIGNWR